MEDQVSPLKRKAHRSPKYPTFALPVALDKVRRVYDSERRTPTTADVIAGHLGYKYTDGPGGRALSGVRQFGLIEEMSGKLRVSDLGFSLLHLPEEDPERLGFLKISALNPNLYRSLHEEYPDHIPSDATLRSNLLKRGFNPDSIAGVLEDFRITMDFARIYEENSEITKENELSVSEKLQVIATTQYHNSDVQPIRASEKLYAFAFEGAGEASLRVSGEYTIEDLEDLKSFLDVTLRGLIRSKKAAPLVP